MIILLINVILIIDHFHIAICISLSLCIFC